MFKVRDEPPTKQIDIFSLSKLQNNVVPGIPLLFVFLISIFGFLNSHSTGAQLHGSKNDYIQMEAFALGRSFTIEMDFNLLSFTPYATLMSFHDTDASNSLSIRLSDSTRIVASGILSTT